MSDPGEELYVRHFRGLGHLEADLRKTWATLRESTRAGWRTEAEKREQEFRRHFS